MSIPITDQTAREGREVAARYWELVTKADGDEAKLATLAQRAGINLQLLPPDRRQTIERLWVGAPRRSGGHRPYAMLQRPLVVQLLAKLADPELNLTVIKAQSGRPGAWSVRGRWLDEVIKPFISENGLGSILGTTGDLYNPTPLKAHPEFRSDARSGAPAYWAELCALLEWLEAEPEYVSPSLLVVFDLLSADLSRKRQAAAAVAAPVALPEDELRRAVLAGLSNFLDGAVGSDGGRHEAVAHALLELEAGSPTCLFDGVLRSHAQEGVRVGGLRRLVALGDVACVRDGNVRASYEVKGRRLGLGDVEATLGNLDEWEGGAPVFVCWVGEGASEDARSRVTSEDRPTTLRIEDDFRRWARMRLLSMNVDGLQSFIRLVGTSLETYGKAADLEGWAAVTVAVRAG